MASGSGGEGGGAAGGGAAKARLDAEDQELWGGLVRLALLLYPARRTWLATAAQVAEWWGSARAASDALRGAARAHVYGTAALARLLRVVQVRSNASA